MIYWEDAFQTTTYIINRLPTPVLNRKSPFKILYHRIPDYRFMRVFGCACWLNLRPYNRNKLNFRSKSCIFIGYSLCHQGYTCLDLSMGKIYVSHNVIFNETLFPYSQDIDSMTVSQATTPVQHVDTQAVLTNIHSMVTRSKNNIHHPRQSSDDFICYPLPRALTAEHVPTTIEPMSYSQTSKSLHWREAMNKEFSALLHNGTGPWYQLPQQQILLDADGFTKSKGRRMGPLSVIKLD